MSFLRWFNSIFLQAVTFNHFSLLTDFFFMPPAAHFCLDTKVGKKSMRTKENFRLVAFWKGSKFCSLNRCSVQRQSPRGLPFVGLTAIFACSPTFRSFYGALLSNDNFERSFLRWFNCNFCMLLRLATLYFSNFHFLLFLLSTFLLSTLHWLLFYASGGQICLDTNLDKSQVEQKKISGL